MKYNEGRRGVVRKLAREAVIFCLLGSGLGIVGTFIVMERGDRAAAISAAKSAVHAELELDFSRAVPIPPGATLGPAINFVKVPLTNRVVLSVRQCPDLGLKVPPGFREYNPIYEREHDCRYFYDAFGEGGGVLVSVPIDSPDQVSIEKGYWTAYKAARQKTILENLMAAGLSGFIFGFPAGFGVWCLYRLVRFAIFG